ncbi:TnsA endonuclease N-terminal domain-containing protein [Vogesella facilis]|uniref:TnsA endonuclease N-terminal domain-containing protein n=1 Tax=Vogesella facilis TaxID=1655232 RepID=A0ABV7RBT5_9NEIS
MLIPSVRKIHNHNSSKVIGCSYSYKMQGQIQWESTLERDWLLHLEANPSIRDIYSQPQTFDYCHEGIWHRYTPDFEARWHENMRLPTMYEVKPHEIAIQEEFKSEANSIRFSLATQGYEYLVIDDETICQAPLLQNLNFLKHYAGVFVTQKERQRIFEYLTKVGPSRIELIATLLGDKGANLAVLYRLLWDGWLDYDKQSQVTPFIQVRLSRGEL